jgi:hypothetical protein
MIEARAYELWENEGKPTGRSLVHWLCAQELFTAPSRGSRSGLSYDMPQWADDRFSTYIGAMLGSAYCLTAQTGVLDGNRPPKQASINFECETVFHLPRRTNVGDGGSGRTAYQARSPGSARL